MTKQTLRVLLADDMPANLRAMTRLLSRRGCEVTSAANGQQAVDLFREEAFDVIMLDLQMPKLGGVEACRTIRELPEGKDVPIIAMSARGTESDLQACRGAGMTACLPKPVNVDALFKIIDSLRKGDASKNAPGPTDADANDKHMILDREEAMRRLQGDETIYELFIQQFNEESDSLLASIRSAAEKGEWTEVAQAAHQLRGIAANLEAKALQNVCATLEREAENGSEADSIAMTKELRIAIQQVARELNTCAKS